MWFRRGDDDDYYDDDDEEFASRRRRIVLAGAALVVAVGIVAVWQLRPQSDSSAPVDGADAAGEAAVSDNGPSGPPSEALAVTTSTAPAADSTAAGADDSTDTGADGRPATVSTTSTTTETEVAPAASAVAAGATPTSAPVSPVSDLGYPTSADGSPLPVVAVFDTDTITITGQVPTQAASTRLAMLAKANSQFPDAEVVNNVVINELVPLSVGVRVIELNSARFPEGTADILPPHATELDRVVTVMNALPNTTVLVVGHADQRGNDTDNFEISDERARAVVNYLRFLGISPTRLSSRAAGSADLLTIGDDDTSLALNRRTEFIFYGLLVE